MPESNPRIFISYRRSDRALTAHWVHREVAAKFGKEEVFLDVEGIPAGFDYRDFLKEMVSQCDVLLAVIGDDWLDVRDAEGQRRLENSNDFVRIEIEAALQRNIPVIPVLVENAWRFHLQRARQAPAATQETPSEPPASVDARQQDDRAAGPLEIITNSIGMKLCAVPAGRFRMGSPDEEPGRYKSEGPVHEVQLTRGFQLGVSPVTQDEYLDVVGSNPSRFTGEGRRPVEQVSWFDAVTFCNRLSEREQLSSYYTINGQQVGIAGGHGYRLPTEAEWEYACRAKTTTPWCFGDDETRLGEFAWFRGNSDSKTHPVATKLPNEWGLHDMHGNVWEWCHDTWDPEKESAPDAGRVLRGGSWFVDRHVCRSVIRFVNLPDYRSNYFSGFRAART